MSNRIVIDLYTDLANNPDKDFGWEKGIQNARNHGYKQEWIERIPKQIWKYCAAVGNPFQTDDIKEGDFILDIGCGAGVDLCVASLLVGEKGKVFGIDITPAMVERAKTNVELAGLTNIVLYEGSSDKLPIESGSLDVVISNGAINLSPAKETVLAEVYRVLRQNGHFIFSDMIRDADNSSESCSASESWANCVAGTVDANEIIKLLAEAGFVKIQLLNTNHYKTSATTVGATFRATKA